MLKAADPEYDSAEIEQLLAELEEQSTSLSLTPNSDSRYDAIRALHRSNDAANANPQLHANIMHPEGSKGSPYLQAIDQQEEEEEQGKACDTPDVAHAGTVFHEDADASKSASFHMPLTSSSKLSSTRECEMHRPVVVELPSPPPSPPSFFGCSCFSLSSYKSVQKKKKMPKGEFSSSKTKAKVQQASANYDGDNNDNNNDDDEWQFISTKIGPRDVDVGGLFDVKKTEREFKRVSLKEKQLTKEAKKLLDTIAST